jgi:hypothetical protein
MCNFKRKKLNFSVDEGDQLVQALRFQYFLWQDTGGRDPGQLAGGDMSLQGYHPGIKWKLKKESCFRWI